MTFSEWTSDWIYAITSKSSGSALRLSSLSLGSSYRVEGTTEMNSILHSN